jgi:DNA-binding NtrC family response regulator
VYPARTSGPQEGLNVVVADEDPVIVGSILATLRSHGLRAFHAYDGRAAVELAFALKNIDLLISNTRIADVPGVELIHLLREERPDLPVIYIANVGRSSPDIEARLPKDVPILREPFTPKQLIDLVRGLVPGNGDGRGNVVGPKVN